MQTARIAIVGAGLSGLYAAFLLEQRGIRDYVLLEARPTLGGRILSVSSDEASASVEGAARDDKDRFDLGPTWFWPALQPELDQLIHDLGLKRFEQHESGDMIVERSPYEAPFRVPGYTGSPKSMRLMGGMGTLVDALQGKLSPACLVVDQQVQRIRRVGRHVELDAENSHGQVTTYPADSVLLAVPPRLALATIDFTPALPDSLSREWHDTPTWMASHAKYVAVYDTPFWQDNNLSGEARSACGPLGEIHDASIPGGSAALFGFFGIAAHTRQTVPAEGLRRYCRAQLVRMFGPQAAQPRTDFIKDWAAEPLTATAADQQDIVGHGAVPAAVDASGVWRGCLVGIASEWSPRFSGYVAGAIEAAGLGVRAVAETVPLRDAWSGHDGMP